MIEKETQDNIIDGIILSKSAKSDGWQYTYTFNEVKECMIEYAKLYCIQNGGSIPSDESVAYDKLLDHAEELKLNTGDK